MRSQPRPQRREFQGGTSSDYPPQADRGYHTFTEGNRTSPAANHQGGQHPKGGSTKMQDRAHRETQRKHLSHQPHIWSQRIGTHQCQPRTAQTQVETRRDTVHTLCQDRATSRKAYPERRGEGTHHHHTIQ